MATKTTVEIPDELFIAAKRHAAERRTTLRALIERGLRAEVHGRAGRQGKAKKTKIRWVTVDGGLPPGVDVKDRTAMLDALGRR